MLTILMPLRFIFLATNADQLSERSPFQTKAVENHVEVYAGFLRKKLRSIGSNVRIEAVRRQGYHLEVDGPC